MYHEEDFLPVSALQHLIFCERRAGLVLLEGCWDDNLYTVEGRIFHERTDETTAEWVGRDMRVVRGLRIHSRSLGLVGRADVLEFHRLGAGSLDKETDPEFAEQGVKLSYTSGRWRPFPVEYKRGRLRREEGFEIQLCAQALCLEAMLQTHVPSGAVYYGKTRRRLPLEFTSELRSQTQVAALRLHELVEVRRVPSPVYQKKCEHCSLKDLCMPKALSSRRSVRRYLAQVLSSVENEE